MCVCVCVCAYAKIISQENGVILDKLASFLITIDPGYSSMVSKDIIDDTKAMSRLKYPIVPYHNCAHIVDVTHATAHQLLSSRIFPLYINAFELFIALISAAIHDYKHGGLNNDFHTKVSSQLAVRCARLKREYDESICINVERGCYYY